MLQAINNYTLDTAIRDYPEESFIEIHEATYDFYESFFGIKRMFKGEKFYYAQNDIFLGRKSDHALIAVINGIIYRIYYGFTDATEEECVTFRNMILSHLQKYIGAESLNNPIVTEVEFGRLLTWKFKMGNVLLELIGYATAIVLTSSIIRKAKPLSI